MVHRGEDDGAPRGGRWCTDRTHTGVARPQFEATTVNRENFGVKTVS